jgi:hypothetical protein
LFLLEVVEELFPQLAAADLIVLGAAAAVFVMAIAYLLVRGRGTLLRWALALPIQMVNHLLYCLLLRMAVLAVLPVVLEVLEAVVLAVELAETEFLLAIITAAAAVPVATQETAGMELIAQ